MAVDRVSADGFTADWDSTKTTDGPYQLRVTITDLWNNTASAKIWVDVDNGRQLKSLRVPLDYPTIEEAIAQATPRSRISVDAAGSPYSPFTVDVPGLWIRSINGRAAIEGNGEEFAVLIKADGVRLQGFRIRGGNIGIGVGGNGNRLMDNIVSEAGVMGIFLNGLRGGRQNLLEGNVVEESWEAGIYLLFAGGNTLKGNTVTDCYDGIVLFVAEDNFLGDNRVADNYRAGVVLFGGRSRLAGNRIEGNNTGIALIGGENRVLGNEIGQNFVGVALELPPEDFSDKYNPLLIFFPDVFIELYGGGRNVVTHNNIRGNLEYGIEVRGDEEVLEALMVELNARENFWGHPSGPHHPEMNPEGKGDKISNHVKFAPWLGEPVQSPRG